MFYESYKHHVDNYAAKTRKEPLLSLPRIEKFNTLPASVKFRKFKHRIDARLKSR